MTTPNQPPKFLALILGFVFIALFPLFAFGEALSVAKQQAKQQGLLGERPDGYLGIVTASPSSDTVQLMKGINRKRREVYKGIAEKNGTALSAVEALAGKKAIDKTPSGQFIMQPDGTWAPKP